LDKKNRFLGIIEIWEGIIENYFPRNLQLSGSKCAVGAFIDGVPKQLLWKR
jgi:hypothetical protein